MSEAIVAHVAKHLGPVDHALPDSGASAPRLDVNVVLPTPQSACIRLVTSGMSGKAMTIPADSGASHHAELMVTLPPDWKLDAGSLADERWYWPVRLLRLFARIPGTFGTWVGIGHSIPNGDPPRPYAPDTRLCGAVILPPVTAPAPFHTLRQDERKIIHFMAVVPVHAEEMELKLRSGLDALVGRLGAAGVNDLIDPARPSMVSRWYRPY